MALCRALRNKGTPCTYAANCEDLCKVHFNSRKPHPNEWEISQNKLRIGEIKKQIECLKTEPLSEAEKAYLDVKAEKKKLLDVRLLERTHYLMERRMALHEAQRAARRDAEDYDEYGPYYDNEPLPAAGAGADAPVAFHEDNQNVHRTETVALVKSSVTTIMSLKIEDRDFVWNASRVSKTPGEIIIRCSLTPAAAVLLIQKYAAADTIYEMVPGIYGKVLDGVLQFIMKSEDSVNLFKILKTELEDNVAMCAQGNLSRLCNVLGGYLEGISTASIADILGDLLPPLMSIESPYARLMAASEILRTYNVPDDTWSDWLEPLDCKIDEVDPMLASMPGTNGRL